MGGVLGEPVVHFVLMGLAIFAVERWTSSGLDPEVIEVDAEQVARLQTQWEERHGVAPGDGETVDLVEDYVREEVLYREAVALGLHHSDPIVRRRMVQAMEFLTEDLNPLPEPSEAELAAFLEESRGEFARPARVSLEHLFFAEERGGGARSREAYQGLKGGGDVEDRGDAFAHGREARGMSRLDLEGQFGRSFAEAAMALPVGQWSEPVRSRYGWHLVRVEERAAGGEARLDEVRGEVRAAWRARERGRENRRAVERLRRGYEVKIEGEGAR